MVVMLGVVSDWIWGRFSVGWVFLVMVMWFDF